MDQGVTSLQAEPAAAEPAITAQAITARGTQLDVPITGMHCAACVARIERIAGRVAGVMAATVNLASERVALRTGPEFELPALVQALQTAGYPVAERTADLSIAGMHCAACVGRVERALLAVPGVLAAEVNLATERARVRALANVADPALAAGVRRVGFDVALPDHDSPDADETTRSAGVRRDGIAAGLALALAAPLLAPMLLMPFGVDTALPGWLQFGLAALVQIVFGARFYRGAWRALLGGVGDMDTLVALGTSAAFGLSVWALAAGGPLYFEASATVIALVRVGKWLEARARQQAGSAIRALAKLRPERARVRRDGIEHTVAVAGLRAGDLVVVRPGECIAADGVVREGRSSADESLLTGESLPVDKAPGSPVTGGAINGEGLLVIEATALGAESRLARMVRLVEDAQAQKPPVQRLVDRVSAVFVPIVIGLAAVTFVAWWLMGVGVAAAAVNAVAVLVIACPCALGLATPAAIMVGTGVAARYGILIRDPAALERAGRLATVVFDKTGTLTEGKPELVALHPAAGQTDASVLRQAAALQCGSEHPLARAVLARAFGPVAAATVTALPGRGVEGVVEGRLTLLGNRRLMQERGLDIAAFAATGAALEVAGRTVSYLADADGVLGLLAFGDAVKPRSASAVAALRASGLRVVLLTGDSQGAADAAARRLGITEIHAGALPEDKAAIIVALREAGGVAMVGDGVNDAAALAAADLGIAMGTGTDVAAAASGITLLRGDPGLVPAALDIARRTHRRIWQGLAWAFAYNLVGIPLAACGLLSPVIAGAAMAFSSVSVVGGALLLRRWRPGDAS